MFLMSDKVVFVTDLFLNIDADQKSIHLYL